MEPMPSMEVVIQALNSLYRGNDNDAREAASKWLMEMQKSVHAWHIADQLLHMNADEESSYFAAQTMRTKIQFSFHEVPVETYQALCSSLMSHCSKIRKDTKHTIVTQLSLALADLALKVASWKNAVKSFIQEFSQKEDHWDFLLELLSVFPEEINCRQLKLGENRRNEVYAELKETAPDFIQFLFRMVEARQNDVTTLSRVFKCLSSWLNIFAIPEQVFLSCNLLHLAFLAVASQNCDSLLHKNAADCICAAIVTVEELECNRNLAEALFKEIHGLVDSYHLSVAMNDIDKCINYARIFTEMGESVLEPMAETPNEGFGDFKVLEVLLTCVGHHNYQVADVTFAFWNHLSDYLYEDKNRAILNLFKPYICRLITALCRLCKYDESNDDVKDDDSDFEDFRQNALDLVKDVQFIVGPDEIVGQLNESLKQHVPNQSWATYEAALFIMQSPAKKVSEKDSKVTSSLLEFIITSVLPSVHHVALQNTFLNLVASLQRWFKENKMYLEMVLPIIIQGFNNPKLAPTSAQCLQQLCETCSTFFVNDLHTLFTILEAVESINLPQASTIKLLEAASSTLSCLEVNKVMEGLQHLCNPSIMNLKRIVETVTEIKNNTRDDPSMWLDRLASIFKAVQLDLAQDQMNPCFEFFIQSWPTLSDIMKKFSSDGRVIEHSCRCMRNGIRSFGRNNSSLILPIVTLMVEIYKEHLHPCCLYMGSVMVDAYAGHQQNVPIFLSMLDEFSGKTFAMTEQINGLVNYPDVVDDFFRLALRFVEQCPQAFLEFAGCKTILLSAIHAVSIPHSDANATVVRFLQTVIKLAQIKIGADSSQKHRQNLVLGLLNDHGLELVSAIIDACLLKVPSRLISYLASTIYELLKIDREATTIWLQEALNRLPLQSTAGCIAVTHEQKQEFLTSITSTENEDDIGDLYKDFSMYFK